MKRSGHGVQWHVAVRPQPCALPPSAEIQIIIHAKVVHCCAQMRAQLGEGPVHQRLDRAKRHLPVLGDLPMREPRKKARLTACRSWRAIAAVHCVRHCRFKTGQSVAPARPSGWLLGAKFVGVFH